MNQKVNARARVITAITSGQLVRPGECSECQKPCTPEAHHDDYDKPLEVRWLCKGCHSALHRPDGRKEVVFMFRVSKTVAQMFLEVVAAEDKSRTKCFEDVVTQRHAELFSKAA